MNQDYNKVKKIIRDGLTEDDLENLNEDELIERSYYQDSVIIKIDPKSKLIDDIATCFDIEHTFEYLMLAPLDFLSRTDGIQGEKEFKDKLWKQVRTFYKGAQDILNRRYRL